MRNCCDSNDWMTEAKRWSCSADGAKADLRIEDLLELAVAEVLANAEDDEILDAAGAPDFFPILHSKKCDSGAARGKGLRQVRDSVSYDQALQINYCF